MKKILYYILTIITLTSCNDITPIIDSENFKADSIRFSLSTYEIFANDMYNEKIYFICRSDEKHLLCYDINDNIIDTIVTDNKIVDISVVNDSCIFYTDYPSLFNYNVKNAKDKSYDYFENIYETVSHPFWKDDYKCVPVYPDNKLTMIDKNSGIVLCLKYYTYGDDYSVVLENNVPVWMRFDIAADSSIMPVSFFGTYPKNHPSDNYHDGGALRMCFNHKSKEIITHTSVDDYVVLCDSMGNKIRDVYFGSQLYKYSPYPKENKNIMAESIKHFYSTTLYDKILFDEYRNLYYRLMTVPIENDSESMTKQNFVDFVIIVADENLNIKYEVFFKGEKYHLLPALINEKGLLLYEKENKKWEGSHTAAWFVFE